MKRGALFRPSRANGVEEWQEINDNSNTLTRTLKLLPPVATSFAQAAQQAGVPYVGHDDEQENPSEVAAAAQDAPEREVRRLPLPRQLQECFDENFGSSSDTRRHLWHKSSMVVAMHPDEATEAIVDACLR